MEISRPLLTTPLAHTGPPPVPGNLWSTWTLDPLALAGIVLFGVLYLRGVHAIRLRGRYRLPMQQAGSFAAGLCVLAVALLSPLDGLSSALFSAHMVQHLLLMLVAAPLLVLGDPLLPLLWSLPLPWRRAVGRVSRWSGVSVPWRLLNLPAVAWVLAAAALWAWHLPLFYEAALRSQPVHALEHLCLLGSALLFWQVAFERHGRGRLGYAAAIAYVLAMGLQSSVLGIVIAFSQPWYAAYAATTTAWHLTPGEDQQIAGLIMWIPAGAVYLAAALALIVRWLQAAEREALRDPPALQGRTYEREPRPTG